MTEDMTEDKRSQIKIEDLIECHFCNKMTVPLDFIYGWNLETIRSLQTLLSFVPERQAGTIGNKIICHACIRDMEDLLHFEYTNAY